MFRSVEQFDGPRYHDDKFLSVNCSRELSTFITAIWYRFEGTQWIAMRTSIGRRRKGTEGYVKASGVTIIEFYVSIYVGRTSAACNLLEQDICIVRITFDTRDTGKAGVA